MNTQGQSGYGRLAVSICLAMTSLLFASYAATFLVAYATEDVGSGSECFWMFTRPEHAAVSDSLSQTGTCVYEDEIKAWVQVLVTNGMPLGVSTAEYMCAKPRSHKATIMPPVDEKLTLEGCTSPDWPGILAEESHCATPGRWFQVVQTPVFGVTSSQDGLGYAGHAGMMDGWIAPEGYSVAVSLTCAVGGNTSNHTGYVHTWEDLMGNPHEVLYEPTPSGTIESVISESGLMDFQGLSFYEFGFHGRVYAESGSFSTGNASGSVSSPGGTDWNTCLDVRCHSCDYVFRTTYHGE